MPALRPETMAERRAALLAAATACFARKGFQATSMRDICEAAGVSIGGLYCHFRSKEEIVLAIAAEPRDEDDHMFDAAGRAVADGKSAFEASCDILRTLMTFVDGEEGQDRLNGDIAMMGEAATTPAIREILAGVDACRIDAFAALLAQDMKPKEAKALAQTLVATLYGMMVLSAFHNGFDREACINALERLMATRPRESAAS